MSDLSIVRVVMAREVAARWVAESAQREYRFTVVGFNTAGDARRMAQLLRVWRDGRGRVAALGSGDSTMGMAEVGEGLELWSSDLEAMRRVATWVEAAGLSTTFIW